MTEIVQGDSVTDQPHLRELDAVESAFPYDQTRVLHFEEKRADGSQFFDYWQNVHAPIGARIPGVRRFVQSRRIDVPGDKYQPAYDGMVELWFDHMEALLAARRSPEWRASTEDEVNFIDHSKVAYLVTEERVIR